MGLGERMPAKSLDSFAQEGMFAVVMKWRMGSWASRAPLKVNTLMWKLCHLNETGQRPQKWMMTWNKWSKFSSLDREECHIPGNLLHENICIFFTSSVSSGVFSLAELLGAPLEIWRILALCKPTRWSWHVFVVLVFANMTCSHRIKYSAGHEIKTNFPFLKVIQELPCITALKLHRFSSRLGIKFSRSPLICAESKPYGNLPHSPGWLWHSYPQVLKYFGFFWCDNLGRRCKIFQ